MLRIPLDKVCVVIEMARDVLGREPRDEEEAPVDGHGEGTPLPSSEDYDAAGSDALFDYVDALNGDEVADLLALVWVGRGDFGRDDWSEAQTQADDETGDGDVIAELLQDPTLPDDLVAGLEALGYDCPED